MIYIKQCFLISTKEYLKTNIKIHEVQRPRYNFWNAKPVVLQFCPRRSLPNVFLALCWVHEKKP